MSFWLRRTDSTGKRQHLLVDVDLMLPLVLVVTVAVATASAPAAFAALSVGIMVAGLVCVVVAKQSVFRRGVWTSWGTAGMSPGYARCYRAGYALVAVGFALLVLLWVSAR